MSKETDRANLERLVREAMEKKTIAVKWVDGRRRQKGRHADGNQMWKMRRPQSRQGGAGDQPHDVQMQGMRASAEHAVTG